MSDTSRPDPGPDPDPAPSAAGPADPESRQWGMFAHLSAIVASFVGLPFLGPLIVWLLRKDSDPYVAAHGAEALNANVSYSIYMFVATIVTVILSFLLIGFLLIPVLALAGVGWLVLAIIAGIKANNGEFYRYPLVIRFVS